MTTSPQQPRQLTIALHNVGPHRDLTLSLRPGMNVLRSCNGGGKSTAIAAAVTALGGQELVTVRDGNLSGHVSVNGVTALEIGRKLTRSGMPSVELAGYSAVGDVIEPGIATNTERGKRLADSHRVKAIMTMIPVPVTAAVLAELTQGMVPAPAGALNVLEAAEAVRNAANGLALAAEKEQENARGRADAEQSRLAGRTVTCTTPVAAAEEEERRAVADLERVRFMAGRRVDQEKRIAEIRATMGTMPDVAAAESEQRAAHAEWERVGREVEVLKAQMAAALESERKAAVVSYAADRRLVAARDEAKTWDRHKAALEEPVDGPVAADIMAAEATVIQCSVVTNRARESALVREGQEAIGIALQTYEAAKVRAEELRAMVKEVPERLGVILNRHGIPGLELEDGRLFHVRDGKRQLFADRLSFGQIVDVAFDIAIPAFAGRVIPIQPAFYSALQPSKQKELAKKAAAKDIFLLTEEPSDDDEISVSWSG